MWTSIAVALATLSPSTTTSADGPLSWTDRWPAALAKARAEGKRTIAVDVWATWCHTCLSMKHYVLSDPAMAELAERHVWLALDYDLEDNAAFFERHPVSVFPTFLVLDAETEAVIARWAGSGSLEQMRTFFAHAAPGDDPLSRGQRALAQARHDEARAIFEAALASPPEDPARRTRLLLGWLETLYATDKPACAQQGRARLSETDDTSQGADFAALVAYCGASLETEEARAVMRDVVARLAPLAADPAARLSVDDRSTAWGIVQMAYEALGDEPRARAAVELRLGLLEAAAAAAPDAKARATFDYHRMEAYLHLGRAAEAIEMLEASRKAQPEDFNHPWRLAKVYLHQGDHPRALAAIDDALAKGYGGRKLRLYSTKIDVLLDAGRAADAKATLTAARGELAKMSEAQVRPFWREELESRARRVADAAR